MSRISDERLAQMINSARRLEIAEYLSAFSELQALRSQPAGVRDDDETYEIGVRDGYEKAVQDIDLLTGGDGEYRYCTDHDPDRHTPDAVAMKARIVDRFAALEPQQKDPVAMTPEEIRLENLKQMATYSGPIVSFKFREPYYLASCDKCGWVGSSEQCGTDSFGDDSDVYCPRCHASGADCGKVAEALTAALVKP